MWFWLKRLALLATAAAMAAAGVVYAVGPHAAAAAAFERYRAAHRAGDAALVTRLTAAREIAFFDEQRRHALHSPREIVAALSYRQRLTILSMRAGVRDGALPLATLRDASPTALYQATRRTWPAVGTLEQMDVLFAVPTGPGSATGYMSLTKLPGATFQKVILALTWGTAFGFERLSDGTWVVDPTPVLETSARENEHWARQVEPSGNEFLMKFYFKADPQRAAALWQPLT